MLKIKRLPDAELEIMNALWDADAPLTAAELETALPGPPRARTTLLTLLARLEEKGCVTREKQGRGYLYTAALTRAAYLPAESRSLWGRLFGGSPATRSRPCRNRHPHRRRHRRAGGILGGIEKRRKCVKFVGRALLARKCSGLRMVPGSMTSIDPYAVGADSISAREPCWLRQVCGRALSAPTCNSPSTCSIIICPVASTFASEVTPMPGDLHTHTTFSDGSTPADKLPFLAACAGMTHLAISDHDSIRSVRYAYAHPVQNGVHLIPATELTAYDYERAHRVHLLCYWPDDCAALADFSAMMAERRLTAMLQSCKELEAICPQFRTEEALELAKDSGTLFKAQVMRVLWQYGLADGMYNTVYKSLFGLKPVRGRILHTPRYEPVDTVLDVIKASRAVVVLAHPSVYHSMELARELIAAGRLDGVEIDHPRNTPEDRAELTRLAKETD